MTQAPTLHNLGGERFVLLTTYRRYGEPVATPVWVLPDAGAAIVSTPEGAGKLKRLRARPARHAPAVRPSRQRQARRARSSRAAPRSSATPPPPRPSTAGSSRKYGVEFRIFMAIEWVVRRGNSTRVVVRITPTA